MVVDGPEVSSSSGTFHGHWVIGSTADADSVTCSSPALRTVVGEGRQEVAMTETVFRHVCPASSPLSHWTYSGPDVTSYTCDLPPSAFKISVDFRC